MKTLNKKNNVLRKKEIIDIYGGKCTCCDETTYEFLTIDHINDNGASHRREIKNSGGTAFYIWLREHNYPKDNYQLLCMNCNFAKSHGGCTHQKEAKA